MTLSPRNFTRDQGPMGPDGVVGDVVLGDDWVAPDDTVQEELQDRREKRRWLTFRSSPLTQKIVTFNLIALVILVAGILHLNDSYRSLAAQRASELAYQSKLIASLFEAHSALGGDLNDAPTFLENLYPGNGMAVFVFDSSATLLGSTTEPDVGTDLPAADPNNTVISDALAAIWNGATAFLISTPRSGESTLESQLATLVPDALDGTTRVETNLATQGGTVFAAASPVRVDGAVQAVVTVTTPAGEIDALARAGRERVLQMFIVAILVSVGLSLVLASTISNPLADLADAAEMGRDRDARKFAPGRIRIPDLTARPDEIGRLSAALRGMVSALYSRIDANEQFAADVAHEIKNPLASLRSAVGTLRVVKRDDQRDKLLDVIEHDVRRLDRLVSDISNASRLDSELVKEEEVEFNLLKMLENLNQFLGEDAGAKGVDYITDMPDSPILMHGLEARLAQVFVNLITNAISFCEEGDAIRVWVRKRENRVLVVVEDTGPGIPEQALTKIFKRFYSERPSEHFGNNSGLGLAISKQIVEAHGGVIWAENIRPTASDVGSEPLGARFVVGLPV